MTRLSYKLDPNGFDYFSNDFLLNGTIFQILIDGAYVVVLVEKLTGITHENREGGNHNGARRVARKLLEAKGVSFEKESRKKKLAPVLDDSNKVDL